MAKIMSTTTRIYYNRK